MIKIVFEKNENRAIAYDSKIKVGECDFEEINDIWNITHTEVDGAYQGQGIARKLVEKLEYYRVEERVRKVWKVKLEFEKSKNLPYEEDAFTYFIDATTCEIVGGE